MGYDLYLLDFDRARWAATAALDGVPDPGCFRVTAGWMWLLMDVMREAGMVSTSGPTDPPEAPDWEAVQRVRLDGERFDPDYYNPRGACTPDQLEYMEANDRYNRYRDEGTVGISWWKLEGNDLFIVTAGECEEAARVWDSTAPDRRRQLLEDILRRDAERRRTSVRPVWTNGGPDVADLEDLVNTFTVFLRLGADGDGFSVE